MPGRKSSSQQGEAPAMRLAGLFLRRKAGREFHSYIQLLDYDPREYEVLLRRWPAEPFLQHLGAFSGPMIVGEDPQVTLLRESQSWSEKLAGKTGQTGAHEHGLCGQKAVFLSVHGGGSQVDPISHKPLELGVVLCYAIPITHSYSVVVSQYPNSPEYPKFYDLSSLLRGMTDSSIKIHPYTREMLASLDHWLREQHAVPGAINTLFAPSLQRRLKMFVPNPLFAPPASANTRETPPPSPHPLLSSTPFPGATVLGGGEESSLHETSAFTVTRLNKTFASLEDQPVEVIVRNPLFSSGLKFGRVDQAVVNQYFGQGTPDYQAVGNKRGKWMVQVQGDGLPDWVDLFPVHKCACEGDGEGVRRCIMTGMSADERDSDSWSPLHYACWYGELEVVKILVEEASAAIGIQNSSGSTPLHLAAATGHTEVVEYLLKQRGTDSFKAALDNDGKSPLAVCLECRMNDWEGTAQLLREAYRNPFHGGLPLSPTLLSFPQPLPSREEVEGGGGELSYRGSLANLDGEGETPRKKKTVRRQRVNFMNGQHQVAHFFRGRDTPAGDVIQDLYRLLRLGQEHHSLFALWIVSNSLELQLGDGDKPLKLLASWESLLSQYGPRERTGEGEVPALYLRRNVFFPLPREKMVSDPIALEFLYADAQRHVLSGYYPCSEDEAISLAGISMQIAYGDHNPAVHKPGFLREQSGQVLPGHMTRSKRRVEFERRVLARHAEMSQTTVEDMQLLNVKYLKHCWQWSYYGATFYEGSLATKASKFPPQAQVKLGRKSHVLVGVGINSFGFHIVNRENNTLVQSLGFEGLEWDVSVEKHQLLLFRRDRSLNILIHTRKAALIYSLVTRMTEQYQQSFDSSHSSAVSSQDQ